jgi:hypothetical protein
VSTENEGLPCDQKKTDPLIEEQNEALIPMNSTEPFRVARS